MKFYEIPQFISAEIFHKISLKIEERFLIIAPLRNIAIENKLS